MSTRNLSPLVICLFLLRLMMLPSAVHGHQSPSGTIYYVSISQGNDNNNGLSESTPFATVSKLNSLALQPGDSVLFKCGDVWRADPLIITRSGSAGQPITFTSYPVSCANQPVLSGSQPVTGWDPYDGYIYVTDLAAGTNAGKFPYGVNQLFRQDFRLRLGRWPNLDAGDGGYSTIDGQPSNNRITDNELPSGDWSGVVAHIKGMRWYILNRQVTDSSSHSLTVGFALECWSGNCTGWGYFLNNHLNTLDQDGEWYYNAASHLLYLYTTSGIPADGQIEGSVILHTDDRSWGGIVLGEDLGDEIAYIVIDNLGLVPATSVVLTHPIIEVIDHTSWEASVGGVVQQPGSLYIWGLPDISPGARLTITVTGKYADTLQPGAALLLTAEVTTVTPDGQPLNNQAWLRLGAWHPVYLPLIHR